MPPRISLKQSSQTILDGACAHHESMLEIDDDATHLLENFQLVSGTLQKSSDKTRAERRRLAKERARRRFRDHALDAAVVTFANKLLDLAGKNRKSALFLKYFPKGTTTPVTTAPYEIELSLVATILSQLKEAPAGAPEKDLLPPLQAAYDGLKSAHEGVKAATQDRAFAFAVEMEARMAVARQLEIDEAELMKQFGKGRRLNSFFLQTEDEVDDDPAVPATPPAGGTPTTA